MLGRENKLEAPFSRVQIRPRLARCVNRVIVQNHKYHALFRVSVVNHLEKVDEIRAFVPFSDEAVHFACTLREQKTPFSRGRTHGSGRYFPTSLATKS